MPRGRKNCVAVRLVLCLGAPSPSLGGAAFLSLVVLPPRPGGGGGALGCGGWTAGGAPGLRGGGGPAGWVEGGAVEGEDAGRRLDFSNHARDFDSGPALWIFWQLSDRVGILGGIGCSGAVLSLRGIVPGLTLPVGRTRIDPGLRRTRIDPGWRNGSLTNRDQDSISVVGKTHSC